MSLYRFSPVLLIGLALLASGCAGVRDVTRSAFNTDLVHQKAPPLIGTDWEFPPYEDGSDPPSLVGTWALVEFFDPG